MSRGTRTPVSGNLSHSMRDNYITHGVQQYYAKVAATYRNPHYPAVRQCLFLWLNKWWENEQDSLKRENVEIRIFDMACGSGEATLCILEWFRTCRLPITPRQSGPSLPSHERRPKTQGIVPPTLGLNSPRPVIFAADPYTSEAFSARTALTCSSLSFNDIADGELPSQSVFLPNTFDVDTSKTTDDDGFANAASPANRDTPPNLPSEAPASVSSTGRDTSSVMLEMAICSFALHLIESPSELFRLLWELSTKTRWLIVTAPHKKPELKDGWGWSKWNVDTWSDTRMNDTIGGILLERVHCRIYRSLNCM